MPRSTLRQKFQAKVFDMNSLLYSVLFCSRGRPGAPACCLLVGPGTGIGHAGRRSLVVPHTAKTRMAAAAGVLVFVLAALPASGCNLAGHTGTARRAKLACAPSFAGVVRETGVAEVSRNTAPRGELSVKGRNPPEHSSWLRFLLIPGHAAQTIRSGEVAIALQKANSKGCSRQCPAQVRR